VNRVWLFLHLLGFTMWLGGAIASMIVGIAAKREERPGLGAVVRAQSNLTKVAIAPGALLTVLSGLILTFQLSGGDLAGFSIWLVIMQGAGLIAALITLLIALPTAARLGRLEPTSEAARYFDELRQRQRIVASISGVLGLVALFAGAMLGNLA
jgi:putative copper export protein